MFDITGDFFDEAYFERGRETGKSWYENYHWMPIRSYKEALAFVDILSLNEKSKVLEVGCGKGFLIKALRGLEISADGCDISEYALQFAPENCWNCSLETEWELVKNKYTHVIMKDVLEHMTPVQLLKNLKLYGKAAQRLMCVIPLGDNGVYRIPEYHKDASHIIAEDMLWWFNILEKADWLVHKTMYHVPGIKDNWFLINPVGNMVIIADYKG